MPSRCFISLALIGSGSLLQAQGITRAQTAREQQALSAAVKYLASRIDATHSSFDVYTDADASGNHFVAKARISSFDETNTKLKDTDPAWKRNDEAAKALLPSMDEASTIRPRSGATCIRASFHPAIRGSTYPWGGWYFMNGILTGQNLEPELNFGTEPDAGFDLSGATRLTFWARGEKGGEKVEFFTLGVAHPNSRKPPLSRYADSAAKISIGPVALKAQWKEYSIDLRGQPLNYVLGGFGWAASATKNALRPEVVFYIDDIRFEKARLDESRFINSYEVNSTDTFDTVMKNVAFTYDNAVALMAFLASGDVPRARLIADALVYATKHDRFFADHRVRNAYQSGDLSLPPGWRPGGKVGVIRLPGWYSYDDQKHKSGRWLEDEFAISTHTGNVAWTMLALLAFYEVVGGDQYLQTAIDLGEWVHTHCQPVRGSGYTAGFEGFDAQVKPLLYRATEHNLDLYAAFERIGRITGEPKWHERANNSLSFVRQMWDDKERKFYTGTRNNTSDEPNTDIAPLDIQAWAHLALREQAALYNRSIDYANGKLRVGDGYDFSVFTTAEHKATGIWYEGTAQMAAAYLQLKDSETWQKIMTFLITQQHSSGGMFASREDKLPTGFATSIYTKSEAWSYYHRLHVGATAWFVLALSKVNPFWMGSKN